MNENTKYNTGAQRDNRDGKLRMSLIPQSSLERLMDRFLEGAEKYGENNWMFGMPVIDLTDSTDRHLRSYLNGDTSEDHLAAVAWNAFVLMFQEDNPEYYSSLDNRVQFPVKNFDKPKT